MSHNLTITVPEDLWEKIEKWRSRLAIAKICQAALAAEVAKFEDLPEQIEELEEIIHRLKTEKIDFERESYARGFVEGISWAKQASYAQLGEKAEIATKRDQSDWILGEDVPTGDEFEIADALCYQRGWLDAVLHFWELVESKL